MAGSGIRAGVVVAHGFSGDRNTMEALSESLARAGYMVLSLDMSGHGMNRNPLVSGTGGTDQLVGDIEAGVGFLRQCRASSRRESQCWATRWGRTGRAGLRLAHGRRRRPRHAGRQHRHAGARAAAQRALSVCRARPARNPTQRHDRGGGPRPAWTRLRSARPTATSRPAPPCGSCRFPAWCTAPYRLAGAFAEIVSWLDQVTGFPARAASPARWQNPVGPPLLWLAFLLVLPGLGLLLAHLAPEPPAGLQRRLAGLLALPLALLLPLPLLPSGAPACSRARAPPTATSPTWPRPACCSSSA